MDKKEQVNKEYLNYKKIFEDIDKNKLDFVDALIQRLAWLKVSVEELEDSIDKKGTMIEYDNGGGQCGIKNNPDVQTHIQYVKNITSITKQLVDLVPTTKEKSKLAELLND